MQTSRHEIKVFGFGSKSDFQLLATEVQKHDGLTTSSIPNVMQPASVETIEEGHASFFFETENAAIALEGITQVLSHVKGVAMLFTPIGSAASPNGDKYDMTVVSSRVFGKLTPFGDIVTEPDVVLNNGEIMASVLNVAQLADVSPRDGAILMAVASDRIAQKPLFSLNEEAA